MELELEQPYPIRIVYLYHYDDRLYFKQLYDQLSGLRRQNYITEWHEWFHGIVSEDVSKSDLGLAGDDLQEKIKANLFNAKAIILLITSKFQSDDKYSGKEMEKLIEDCSNKGTRIWPIIANYIDLNAMTYHKYEILYGKTKPGTGFNPQDEFYKNVAEIIRREIMQMIAEAYASLGNKYTNEAELQTALVAYNQSFLFMHDCPQALLGKGRILYKLNKSEEAAQCFNKIINYSENYKQQNGKINLPLSKQLIAIYYKGLALLQLQRYEQAARSFQEVYQLVPSSMPFIYKSICAQAYYGEGNAHLALSKQISPSPEYIHRAYTAYNQAERLVPHHTIYTAKIGEVCQIIGDILSNQIEKIDYYNKALNKFQQVLRYSQNNAFAYIGLGDALRSLSCYEEALDAYEKACSIDTHATKAYAGLGKLYLQTHQPQKALSALDLALSLDNTNNIYHYHRGLALAKLERYQQALTAFDDACTHGFSQTDMLLGRASSFLALAEIEDCCGQKHHAKKYYKKASELYFSILQKQPAFEDSNIFSCLGKAHLGLKELDIAERYYRQAIQLPPFKPDAYMGMGKILLERGNASTAFRYFERGKEQYQKSGSIIDKFNVFMSYGDAYYQIALGLEGNDYYTHQENARECYKTATESGAHLLAYIGLGKSCTALHLYQDAITAFDFVLQIDPKLIKCYEFKAECYCELGHFAGACASYEQAIANGFDSASIYNKWGMALLAMNSYYQAEKSFNHIIEHPQNRTSEDVAYAYYGRGIAQSKMKMKRVEEALHSFEQAKQLIPSICVQSQGKLALENIISSIEISLYIGSKFASSYRNKGKALLILGERFDDAIAAFTKAIEYGDNSADVYSQRGEAYYQSQEYQKALRDYVTAFNIDPYHQHIQYWQERITEIRAQRPESLAKRIAFRLLAFFA